MYDLLPFEVCEFHKTNAVVSYDLINKHILKYVSINNIYNSAIKNIMTHLYMRTIHLV